MDRFDKLRRSRGKAVDRALDDAIASLSIRDDPRIVPSRLLALPSSALDRIYAHLSSRDALRLSATCKQVYPHRLSAYTALQFYFQAERYGLASLIRTFSSIRMLSDLLCVRPEYCSAVHSIIISDSFLPSNEPDLPGVLTWDMLVQYVDDSVGHMLARLPNLHSFTWSLGGCSHLSSAVRTIQQLKVMPSLRKLSLYTLTGLPDEKSSFSPTSLEQFTIFYVGLSPYWCLPFVQANSHLRVIHLDGLPDAGDPTWLAALCNAATSWRNLHTLTVTGTILMEFKRIVQHCAVRTTLVILTVLSHSSYRQ